MSESDIRKPSLTGEDSDWDILQEWQDTALVPMKEDIMEWLVKTLGYDIDLSDGLLPALDNGVHLCKLLQAIESNKNAAEADKDVELKKIKVKCKENAKSGTWFARDNIANFLKCCREYGVKEECLFETEDLVSHKNEKCVILCLLELARLGMKYGIEPPGLIALEKEIDQEEEEQQNGFDSENSSVFDEKVGDDKLKEEQQPAKEAQQQKAKSKKPAAKSDKLDTEVMKVIGKCNCENHFQMDRISPGHYVIGGKNMFVRLLKDKHIMIRVGGGWDTLQHYISTHDPCRIIQFKRDGNIAANSKGDFAHARGRYKSAGGKKQC